MAIDGLHHLVLKVPDLPKAEQFYHDLLGLDVLFREGTKDGEFGKVPDDIDWPATVERGVEPDMSFLGRDAFALALAAEDEEKDAGASRLDHVAFDAEDRDAIRDRAADLDCEYETRSHAVFVTDRYGVEWELNVSSPRPKRRWRR